MERGLSPADGDDGRAECRQPFQPLLHLAEGYWRREVIVLVAIGAREIAPPNGYDMCNNWMPRRKQPARYCPELMQANLDPIDSPHLRRIAFAGSGFQIRKQVRPAIIALT
jgi:hypothetical protein